jgi:hypothetical protein
VHICNTVRQSHILLSSESQGDNGWYALGDPIKEVVLTHKVHVQIGIVDVNVGGAR